MKGAEMDLQGTGERNVVSCIKGRGGGGGVLPTCRGLAMTGGALWGQISTFFK